MKKMLTIEPQTGIFAVRGEVLLRAILVHLLLNFRNLPPAISKLSSQEVTGGSCGSSSNPAIHA